MTSFDRSVEVINVSDDDLIAMSPHRVSDIMSTPSPRRTLLESVSARFEENRRERQDRLQRMRNKQETEKAHSLYLKRNVASPYELNRARPIVNAWAQRNGRRKVEMTERQRQRLREIETVDRRNSPVRNIHPQASLNQTNNSDDYSERCPVVGCGIHFTDLALHKSHHKQFEHSPCNPLLHMPNGCLSEIPLGYICPKCGESFQRSMDCQEHMVLKDHLSLLCPLPVCSYMCPQCLALFPEQMRCHTHMENSHHFQPAYPFTDDLQRDPTECPRTVPVPSVLGGDLVVRARGVGFTVTCVDCGLVVGDRREMKQHQRETQDSHMFTATAHGGLAELFAEYLGGHTCSSCMQILSGVSLGDKHECARGMQGTITDLRCASFSEFVRRAGLTLSRNDLNLSSSSRGRSQAGLTLGRTGVDTSSSSWEHSQSSLDSSVLVIDTSPGTPVPGSSEDSSFLPSSSSGQRLNCDSPSRNKRVHEVLISSSSEEDGEELTRSARKKQKVERSENNSFVSKMLNLAYGLENGEKSGSDKGSKSTGFDSYKRSQKLVSNGLRSSENSCEDSNQICPKLPVSLKLDEPVKSPNPCSNSSKRSTSSISQESSSSSSCHRPFQSVLNDDTSSKLGSTGPSSVLERINFNKPMSPPHSQAGFAMEKIHSNKPMSSHPNEASSPLDSINSNKPMSPKQGSSGPEYLIMNRPVSSLQSQANSALDRIDFNRPMSPPHSQSSSVSEKNQSVSSLQGQGNSALDRINFNRPMSPSHSQSSSVSEKNQSVSSLQGQGNSALDRINFNKPMSPPLKQGSTPRERNKFINLNGPVSPPQRQSSTPRERINLNGHVSPPQSNSVLDRCTFTDRLHPPSSREPENLHTMRLIIFLDLDNWGAFFRKLPQCLPDRTFVWAFYGGKNQWKPPRLCVPYERLLDSGCLHFHNQCGSSKDAADFAICLTVGKMDERLPKDVPFTILSGDKGFLEVERQMKMSSRRTVVIDPHNVAEKSNDMLYALIVSVIHD